MSDDEPRLTGRLAVGDGPGSPWTLPWTLHWEEWGRADGVPVVYLHGGPGGTLGRSLYRRRFDLDRVRLIGLEQRGCGRSTPHLSDPSVPIDEVDTAALVADLETLRRDRGVERWILNGVSWGSTLALAYAAAHPERVLGLVLVAVTTTGRAEVDQITEGVGTVFPEAWDRFAGHAEAAGLGYRRGEGRLIDAYARLVEHPDPAVREAATQEWALREDTHVSLASGAVVRDPRWEDPRFRLAYFRLTAHLWSHDAFCQPPLLEQVDRFAHLPAVLVHGRADVSSPLVTAWRLAQRWPAARLVVLEGDGHGGADMTTAWEAANAELVERCASR